MLKRFHPTAFLSHPFAMYRYWRGNKGPLHEVMLLRAGRMLLGGRFDPKLAREVIGELRTGDWVPMNSAEGQSLPGNRPSHFFGKFLYFIVRMKRPEVMVETGVAHGVSSWTILNAMHKNGCGRLYSIDLPDKDLRSYNPGNLQKSSGWAVPDSLRARWELRLGPSRELLPVLLQELGDIDVFFHDSDHSYDNMHFEFAAVRPYLRENGLIISDDVHKNSSFAEFVASERLRGICFLSKGGAAVKH
ncbi:MAG: hypothetical protein RL213_1309 [Bacteroidota bacterium]|jgi:predicted O-methyltransferase YrrM